MLVAEVHIAKVLNLKSGKILDLTTPHNIAPPLTIGWYNIYLFQMYANRNLRIPIGMISVLNCSYTLLAHSTMFEAHLRVCGFATVPTQDGLSFLENLLC